MASLRGAGVLAPMTVRGHGLLLRPLTTADQPAVEDAMRDPGVLRWAAGNAVLAAPVHDRARTWLVSRLSAFFGYLGFRDVHRTPDQAIAGYWVTPAARGHSVTARALDTAATWAFTPARDGGLGLHRITLDHAVINPGSCHAATRAGFREEGLMREYFVEPDGTRHDCHLHARLATDRVTLPTAAA